MVTETLIISLETKGATHLTLCTQRIDLPCGPECMSLAPFPVWRHVQHAKNQRKKKTKCLAGVPAQATKTNQLNAGKKTWRRLWKYRHLSGYLITDWHSPLLSERVPSLSIVGDKPKQLGRTLPSASQAQDGAGRASVHDEFRASPVCNPNQKCNMTSIVNSQHQQPGCCDKKLPRLKQSWTHYLLHCGA